MEVAGQWRQEWAGTAEYGKVTEGGVTRQVARAMEVLNASAPGARVRVLRAAYHSTAGPGAPASSYLLHSSRRVISSGYNFVEQDNSPSKPLEISSTPLESSPDIADEKGNYKVTEPDDFEISEPSKWRSAKSMNSTRMPSEESSSTDNNSIIDLDYNYKNTAKKRSDSQNIYKQTSPISSLLDAPVTLSTLKYKSLLNGSDSWTNRRKSYSFEETPELDESILRGVDYLTMESSTDSGICKSNEIVNDPNNLESSKYIERKTKMDDIHEETFKDWLSKNRHKSYINHIKSNKEQIINMERIDESKITLQSTGKMSISLPTSTKIESHYETKISRDNEDSDKRTKKVEFCKTELHFAAESGTVNIIATDEKPPPSNDFRKRRNLFVPITDSFNKSITLFGEKSDAFDIKKKETFINEVIAIDENIAATKSILKNKIPKPKPYLLGENMAFGDSIETTVKDDLNNNVGHVTTGVSLINRQLQMERRLSNDSKSSVGSETDWNSFQKSTFRTNKTGPIHHMRSNQDTEETQLKTSQIERDVSATIQNKFKIAHLSPTPLQSRTRQLRESDLTYFGVAKSGETQNEKRKLSLDSIYDEDNVKEEMFHSVKLVKLISNSVCNSEADSDETPDYENLPMKYNYTPKPAPRSRSKYESYLGVKEKELNPILEKDVENVETQTRRIRLKKQMVPLNNRSLSEPPKASRQKRVEKISKSQVKVNQTKDSLLSKYSPGTTEKSQKTKISEIKVPVPKKKIIENESPLYVNLQVKDGKKHTVENNNNSYCQNIGAKKTECKPLVANVNPKLAKSPKNKDNINLADSNVTVQRMNSDKIRMEEQHSEVKRDSNRRTKVLVTPEKSPSKGSETSCDKDRNTEKSSSRDRKVINRPTQKNRPSKPNNLSHNRNLVPVKDLLSSRDNRDGEESTLDSESKTTKIQKSRYKLATDITGSKTSVKEKQDAQKNVHTGDMSLSKTTIKTDKNKCKRGKYVINYDDKNGTVSSICKIRPGHSSSRKKNVENYENKENFKDHTLKMKNVSNKNDLLSRTKEDFNWEFEVENNKSQETILPHTINVIV